MQPPLEVLNQMLTLRIHIDPADDQNGCLQVMPSSHKLGVLKHSEINEHVDKNRVVNCIAKKGDTLIMRPLLLHSSSKALNPSHRRTLHLEYSS